MGTLSHASFLSLEAILLSTRVANASRRRVLETFLVSTVDATVLYYYLHIVTQTVGSGIGAASLLDRCGGRDVGRMGMIQTHSSIVKIIASKMNYSIHHFHNEMFEVQRSYLFLLPDNLKIFSACETDLGALFLSAMFSCWFQGSACCFSRKQKYCPIKLVSMRRMRIGSFDTHD